MIEVQVRAENEVDVVAAHARLGQLLEEGKRSLRIRSPVRCLSLPTHVSTTTRTPRDSTGNVWIDRQRFRSSSMNRGNIHDRCGSIVSWVAFANIDVNGTSGKSSATR